MTYEYPKHTLLIEATLADGQKQRRMEMEPVSRHLGDYCLAHAEDEAYCVFITTFLNNNVISDFRAKRFMEYYNNAGTKYITGMKILPIQTTELKILLRFDVKYSRLFVNSWGGILRRPPHCCVKWDFNVLIEKSYFMAYK